MEIRKLHSDLITPMRGTEGAAGYDLFMPEAGDNLGGYSHLVGLGFAAKVPVGYVALILPRSSAGVKHGIRLGNTVGVIDSDYEGEWKVNIRTAPGKVVNWQAGERLFQFVVVPVGTPELVFVDEFSTSSKRGAGGFGSTGVAAESLKHVYLPFRDPNTDRGFSWQRFRFDELTAKQKGWLDESYAKGLRNTQSEAEFEALYVKHFES